MWNGREGSKNGSIKDSDYLGLISETHVIENQIPQAVLLTSIHMPMLNISTHKNKIKISISLKNLFVYKMV